MTSLFGKALLLGKDEDKTTSNEPEKKRPAADDAPKPRKKPKQSGGAPRRVPELKRLRGRQALLFTCASRQERKAAIELWELLREYAGRLLPADDEPAEEASLGAALKAEAAAPGVEVTMHDLSQAGVGWATVDPRVDVVALAAALMDDALAGGLAAGRRHVVRVLPMRAVVFAGLWECLEAAAPQIAEAFGGLGRGPGGACLDAEAARGAGAEALAKARGRAEGEVVEAGAAAPRSYAVVVKRRNAEEFPKEAAVKALAALVPPQHPVDLKSPEVTILVEVFKGLCGVSVVPGFAARRDFNLAAAAGKQERPRPPQHKQA
mmetsp:Transcript_7455/g.22049  ORF Transcript_7455/g.22049 Transcript_7455/m.22049 type:complete len:321 (+) Transcript_7455:551-1513(+)